MSDQVIIHGCDRARDDATDGAEHEARGVSVAGPDIVTLGCRLNGYESEVMRAHANAAGLRDAVIVNTCAVTNEAVRQAAQTVRRLRRDRPEARIIVTGCAVQIDPDRFVQIDGVDYVIGNAEKMSAATFTALSGETAARVMVNDIMSVRETAPHMVTSFTGRARAFVEVQNGCDHRCTFCIIPFGRGPSRSVPAGDVVRQVRLLVESGYREVVLTGVDITSYGPDLPGDMTLGKLVRHVLRHVPDLKRLRLSSIDQVEVDGDLVRAFAEDDRLMPHLHLSLQSGDDMILKRMKRRHLRADSIRFCEGIRRLRPDMVFGGDLIAGFPTETDAMFEQSLGLVEDCGLTYLHVFPYSARRGTPAARMPQVHGAIIRERADRLRARAGERLAAFLGAQVGGMADVLFEGHGIARTRQFAEVRVGQAGRDRVGTIGRVRLKASTPTQLMGEVVTE